MLNSDQVNDLVTNSATRRTFGKAMLAAGGWAAAFLGLPTESAAQTSVSDEDVLNFALLVEYVDTEYFTMATYGKRMEDVGIPVSGRGRQGPTIGGSAVALSGLTRVLAEHLTLDEQHTS